MEERERGCVRQGWPERSGALVCSGAGICCSDAFSLICIWLRFRAGTVLHPSVLLSRYNVPWHTDSSSRRSPRPQPSHSRNYYCVLLMLAYFLNYQATATVLPAETTPTQMAPYISQTIDSLISQTRLIICGLCTVSKWEKQHTSERHCRPLCVFVCVFVSVKKEEERCRWKSATWKSKW